MKLNRHALLFLGLWLPGTAFSVAPVTQADVDAITEQLEAYVDDAMNAWDTPGLAIGIVAEDQLVYAQGFGVRQLGHEDPIDPETVFQIGSSTKAFLGLTQAMLVDDETLTWADRVIDHYPEFRLQDPWVTREFRFDDLLTQRSGLPAYTATNMTFYNYPAIDVIRSLAHVSPETSFRAEFAYQNAFHLIAGEIVAKYNDAPDWNHVLQTRIFDPLDMSSSSYTADAMKAITNRAHGHYFDRTRFIVDPLAPFPYNAGGAGNINSNIKDLSQWLRLQINQGQIDGKRLLSADVLRTTHEPRVVLTGFIRDAMALSDDDLVTYATGWANHSTPKGRVIEHGGGTIGFTSHVAFDPDRKFGVVVLNNQSVNIGGGLAIPVGKYILGLLQEREETDYAAESLSQMQAIMADMEADLKQPENALPHRPIQRYTGTYESPAMGQITIRADNDALKFTIGPDATRVELKPWSGDVFVSETTFPAYGPNPFIERRKLRFMADADDTITGFDWSDGIDASGQPPFLRKSD